jgi:hypothetical protein
VEGDKDVGEEARAGAKRCFHEVSG